MQGLSRTVRSHTCKGCHEREEPHMQGSKSSKKFIVVSTPGMYAPFTDDIIGMPSSARMGYIEAAQADREGPMTTSISGCCQGNKRSSGCQPNLPRPGFRQLQEQNDIDIHLPNRSAHCPTIHTSDAMCKAAALQQSPSAGGR